MRRRPTPASGRNAGDIGNQLDIVADLINYGLPTSVYSVDWGSFDTHSAQAETMPVCSLPWTQRSRLHERVPEAGAGQSPSPPIYSEFGRTTKVNASAGTDHSSASVVLVVGPGVKGGFYGATPSFTHLDPLRQPDLHDGLPQGLRHGPGAGPRHRKPRRTCSAARSSPSNSCSVSLPRPRPPACSAPPFERRLSGLGPRGGATWSPPAWLYVLYIGQGLCGPLSMMF